jgi:hypothetical protein
MLSCVFPDFPLNAAFRERNPEKVKDNNDYWNTLRRVEGLAEFLERVKPEYRRRIVED